MLPLMIDGGGQDNENWLKDLSVSMCNEFMKRHKLRKHRSHEEKASDRNDDENNNEVKKEKNEANDKVNESSESIGPSEQYDPDEISEALIDYIRMQQDLVAASSSSGGGGGGGLDEVFMRGGRPMLFNTQPKITQPRTNPIRQSLTNVAGQQVNPKKKDSICQLLGYRW
jgi:hypothetical protein